jgi:hypothetical protein
MATQRRFSKLLGPTGFAIGDPVVLVAVAGALLAFPFSAILLGLFSVLVGTFLILAIPFLLVVYVLFAIATARILIGVCRRLLGSDRHTGKPSFAQKNFEPSLAGTGLWDRWID